MPVTVVNGYITAAELKATLSMSAETFADDDVARAINAASRAVEEFTGQRFWLDGSNATRVYTATTGDLVDLGYPPLTTLVTLKTDQDNDGTFETTWASTEYTLLPLNAATDGFPYTSIFRKSTAANVFPSYYAGTVQIVGKFGWPAVPAEVVQATVIEAARLLKRAREAPFGVAGATIDGAGIRLLDRIDADAEFLLRPFDVRQRVR